MVVAIYARVSSKPQTQGASLETQKSLCQDYCCLNGLKVSMTIEETGTAWKTLKEEKFTKAVQKSSIQPGLIGLINTIRKSRGRKTIVCYHPDRFSRNLTNAKVYLKWCEQYKIDLIFIPTDTRGDLVVPGNRTTVLREISQAQAESDNISRRVRDSYKRRRRVSRTNLISHFPDNMREIAIVIYKRSKYQTLSQSLAIVKNSLKDFTIQQLRKLYMDYIDSIPCSKCVNREDKDIFICEDCMKAIHRHCYEGIAQKNFCYVCQECLNKRDSELGEILGRLQFNQN